MARPIVIMEDDAYSKRYRPRKIGRQLRGVEVTIPRVIADREARKKGFINERGEPDLDAFFREYEVEWLYDDFGGGYLRFVEATIEKDNE